MYLGNVWVHAVDVLTLIRTAKARYSVRFGEKTNLVRKSIPFPYQIRIILTRSRTLPPDTSDGVAECVTTFGLKEEGGI